MGRVRLLDTGRFPGIPSAYKKSQGGKEAWVTPLHNSDDWKSVLMSPGQEDVHTTHPNAAAALAHAEQHFGSSPEWDGNDAPSGWEKKQYDPQIGGGTYFEKSANGKTASVNKEPDGWNADGLHDDGSAGMAPHDFHPTPGRGACSCRRVSGGPAQREDCQSPG